MKITVLDGTKTRKISPKHAQREIETYMERKERAYPSDIARDLRIPLKTVVQILDTMEKEGTVRKTKR